MGSDLCPINVTRLKSTVTKVSGPNGLWETTHLKVCSEVCKFSPSRPSSHLHLSLVDISFDFGAYNKCRSGYIGQGLVLK